MHVIGVVKIKIPNYKHQITNKLQIQNPNDQNPVFKILNLLFGIYLEFDACYLVIALAIFSLCHFFANITVKLLRETLFVWY